MVKNKLKVTSFLIRSLNRLGILKFVSDEAYVKWRFKDTFGYKLNLEAPKTFNEKIQWLKLNDHNPKYTQLVDKYMVRQFIEEKIGYKYLNPIIGVWDHVDDIDWEKLPDKFVMKCTHDSGGIIICTDKTKLNIKHARRKLRYFLQKNYYYPSREWPYKNVKPRIIAEKYLEQGENNELRDYRFFCFNGEPSFVTVDLSINDKSNTRRNVYDLNWQLMDVNISYPQEKNIVIEKPYNFEEMINLAKILSENIPFVRIDFYNIEGNIIFGEMTFYHQSGFGKITPEEFHKEMGDNINLNLVPKQQKG